MGGGSYIHDKLAGQEIRMYQQTNSTPGLPLCVPEIGCNLGLVYHRENSLNNSGRLGSGIGKLHPSSNGNKQIHGICTVMVEKHGLPSKS